MRTKELGIGDLFLRLLVLPSSTTKASADIEHLEMIAVNTAIVIMDILAFNSIVLIIIYLQMALRELDDNQVSVRRISA